MYRHQLHALPRMFIGILLGMLLTACATLRPDPPQVQLTGLEITDLSLSHANFLASLRLYNPNALSLEVEGIDFKLSLNDLPIAQGRTAKAFSLPAEEYADAALRLSTSYFDLLRLSGSLRDQTELSYRLEGEILIGGLGILRSAIPILHEGILPLSGSLNQLIPAGPVLRPPGDMFFQPPPTPRP